MSGEVVRRKGGSGNRRASTLTLTGVSGTGGRGRRAAARRRDSAPALDAQKSPQLRHAPEVGGRLKVHVAKIRLVSGVAKAGSETLTEYCEHQGTAR